MKGKIICILVMTLLIATVLVIMSNFTFFQKVAKNSAPIKDIDYMNHLFFNNGGFYL
jgi:hypothetical protein